MFPILQMSGLVGLLVALLFSLPALVVLGLVIYKLSQIAEYNRQTVQALGRIDARLEDIENRDRRPRRADRTNREE